MEKIRLPGRNERLASTILDKFPSFTAFSYAVGDSESVVSKIVNGWRKIDARRLSKWATALGCNESELIQ